MTLRKTLMVLGLAGVVAALAVVGTALAQTPTPQGSQAGANYHEFFLDRLAAALNVTREQLNNAFTQARNDTVDQAQKDGKLTQDQANRLKSQQGIGPFGFGFPGPKRGHPGAMGFMVGPQLKDAIAGALGMTPQELSSQLRSGKTLAELAQGKEQAVKDAIVKSVKTQLDQAVANGRMTADQEKQILDKIQNSDLNSFAGPMGKGGLRKGPNRGGDGNRGPAPFQRGTGL